MPTFFLNSLTHALMITGFVFVMMLVIEYFNGHTEAIWQWGLRVDFLRAKEINFIIGLFIGLTGYFANW